MQGTVAVVGMVTVYWHVWKVLFLITVLLGGYWISWILASRSQWLNNGYMQIAVVVVAMFKLSKCVASILMLEIGAIVRLLNAMDSREVLNNDTDTSEVRLLWTCSHVSNMCFFFIFSVLAIGALVCGYLVFATAQ